MKPHRCPICDGRGIVPGGFYNATGETWTATNAAEPCRACNGIGIIYERGDFCRDIGQ